MSIGGSASKGNSYGYSNRDALNYNQSTGGSYIDPNQQPFLNQLREMSLGRYSSAQPVIDAAGGAAQDTAQQALTNLQGLGNPNEVVGAQLTGLRSGLDDIYAQGRGQIGDNAISAGAFGGARHGLTEAALGGEIGKAYTQGYGDIMANAQRQSINANTAAMAGAPQLLNTAIQSQFAPLQALQGLLGDPTILQSQQSEGIGIDTARGENWSNEKSARFGFGYK
ncbi:hypothetical protein [Shimia aestuarii]|uniref:Uncharacterized protein n=1 Tax=Shimia aestuarii TaxID=254406 RepID=A0A1I4HS74_9RHOB|nr:hypothetical protein [Shimia aestuarii]SFL44660.1 hypothetical protein SAMN04488042_101230 [Shimia aestuarii]